MKTNKKLCVEPKRFITFILISTLVAILSLCVLIPLFRLWFFNVDMNIFGLTSEEAYQAIMTKRLAFANASSFNNWLYYLPTLSKMLLGAVSIMTFLAATVGSWNLIVYAMKCQAMAKKRS